MPKVSIITPIYQTEKYLEKCLKSLINQTLSDIELIWIGNGANEACKQIIEKNKTKNVKLIWFPQNIGYTGAMNAGLKAATGDYIGFCDSDDWIDPDYYEKLYEQVIRGSADIIYCGFIEEYEDHSKKRELLKNDDQTIFSCLLAGSVWNALFKHEFIQQHQICFGNSHSNFCRDNIFAAQACLVAKKYVLNTDVFYHYRQGKESVTHSFQKDNLHQEMSELIKDLFSLPILREVPADRANAFTDFLFRSIPVAAVKKFPEESKNFIVSAYFQKIFRNTQAFSYPTIGQRIFSISYHLNKPFMKIRFLGISVKFKLKRRRNL